MDNKPTTIQEAFASGHRFKRPGWVNWHEVNEDPLYSTYNRLDILATDWVIETEERAKAIKDLQDKISELREQLWALM